MFQRYCWLLVLLLPPFVAGCAMCSSCDDYTYATEGGRWQRHDPVNGRVASIFEPAGSVAVTDAWEMTGPTPASEDDAAMEPETDTATDLFPSDQSVLR
jgi:hypothetical protein